MAPKTEAVLARLDEALLGHRCVTAWLGYGDALFLGFGNEVLPARDDHGRRTDPPFDLHSNFADWWIEKDGADLHGDDRESSERAVEALLGESVKTYRLDASRCSLDVGFEDGRVLSVRGWEDSLGENTDAWCIDAPDGLILAMAPDGRTNIAPKSTPIQEWFSH